MAGKDRGMWKLGEQLQYSEILTLVNLDLEEQK